MAKSKPKLPLTKRQQQAFADLSESKDTLVPQPDDLPASIDKRKNTQVDAFMEKHKAVARMQFMHVGKQWFEAQHLAAKKEVAALLGINETELEPGHDEMFSFGNIGLRLKVDNGQNRLDRDTLRTVLMTDMKMSADKAEALITKAQKKGKPPVHLTPTLINT